MSEPVIESSGNVFADLGFDPAEAAVLKMRADLLNDLRRHLKQSGLAPQQIADRFHLAPGRAAALLEGDWEKFSVEALITLASRAGLKVSLALAA
ncbi:MAG: XRE family transcriptional regulator [Acidobacteriota bacterium]|nr:XRE family transcriptional regulator [Acidobacteriota bacterium]